ncbi:MULTISPECIES: DNA-3-methyladenine glycosylase I [Pseudoalteromonas]|uniref:3-methyladenine DNA glycosylase n=1 Tax=Pseudoalteromonas amylolytica TaxID=1859457 RepID=A0A1S1MMU6_9GAMM|nr:MULTISPECIES: DNA-3-methyladenine glycosylase I [Pseudoalteromonas]MCF6437682.1 DNA-3-methyladenine glycosylase I [Pseudoalteromonas sp. MMG022]OHU85944.1 3-methyladenine DNA glycosylase [Pseudoalteromonas sp. JW3]OHU89445.1 3-methyladenine DNA glycosylase [Pseudoalteromonas amylolytica]
MEKFNNILARASERKGGENKVLSLLSEPKTSTQLTMLSDSEWLEEFTRKVFQSGFYWSVIDAKWSGFREVFWDFDANKLLMMSPDMLEQRANDERIVRNYKKVMTIPVNCLMIHEVAQTHGSFAQFIAQWPCDDIVGLWLYLKQHGARLGGNTGPFALRAMGKDTFILSRDVEAYLRCHEIIEGGLHSKKSLLAAQAFFNTLVAQSGWTLQSLSQLIALSVGDNYISAGQKE